MTTLKRLKLNNLFTYRLGDHAIILKWTNTFQTVNSLKLLKMRNKCGAIVQHFSVLSHTGRVTYGKHTTNQQLPLSRSGVVCICCDSQAGTLTIKIREATEQRDVSNKSKL